MPRLTLDIPSMTEPNAGTSDQTVAETSETASEDGRDGEPTFVQWVECWTDSTET